MSRYAFFNGEVMLVNRRNKGGVYDNPVTEAEKKHNDWMKKVALPLSDLRARPMDNYFEVVFTGAFDNPDNAGVDPFAELEEIETN